MLFKCQVSWALVPSAQTRQRHIHVFIVVVSAWVETKGEMKFCKDPESC